MYACTCFLHLWIGCRVSLSQLASSCFVNAFGWLTLLMDVIDEIDDEWILA